MPQRKIIQKESNISFQNIPNINEQRAITNIEPNINFQRTSFNNFQNIVEPRTITKTEPNINMQRINFQNAPYIKEQRPKFTNIPNMNEQKIYQNIPVEKVQKTIFKNNPNLSIQNGQIQNSPKMNIQSSIIQNIPHYGTTYENYPKQNNYIDNINQSKIINNVYTTDNHLQTQYKNNLISNKINIYPSNNQISYVPTNLSNITNNNFIKQKPQIETFGISNINNRPNYMTLFSTHNIENNYYNNLNKGEAILNQIKTTPNMDKPLPYSYASYEPDVNSGEEHEPDNIHQPKTFLTSPKVDIMPNNLFNTKSVFNLPKAFNPIKTSFIVPHNQTKIPTITNTIINSNQAPRITQNIKRTFAISPPKKNIMTNPIISRVITNRPVINNLSVIGPNYSQVPINSFSSRTINRLPTTYSKINYNPRYVGQANQGIVYNQSNNFHINIHPQAVSKSPLRYNITNILNNPRQTKRHLIYFPRNY